MVCPACAIQIACRDQLVHVYVCVQQVYVYVHVQLYDQLVHVYVCVQQVYVYMHVQLYDELVRVCAGTSWCMLRAWERSRGSPKP